MLQCFKRRISSNCVWTVQHVSIFWLHSESNVNQWLDIRHFSCFAAKSAGRESLTVAAGMAQLDQMVRSGAVSVVDRSWPWFCFQSFFYFQCFHCASVQFQLQYPGTLRRKCAGGTGWNGWRQSDWHLGVMPCRALSCFLLRSSLGTEGIWLWDDLQRKCSLGWGPLLYVYRLWTRRIDRTLWWGLWYDGTDWKKFSSDLFEWLLILFQFERRDPPTGELLC